MNHNPDPSTPLRFFKETLKSDSFYADELINIFLLRPVAAVIVRMLVRTPVTPNQVTIAAIVTGFAAAAMYLGNSPASFVIAGLLVTAKDVLDDADGQLARAKRMYSRRGRFLDSIGDFFVDLALFFAITYAVWHSHSSTVVVVLGMCSFFGITLRVSYHVFYQVSFLHLEKKYGLNRIIEEVTGEDLSGDPVALRLQRVFNLIYTWQDKFIGRIDRWCKGVEYSDETNRKWYKDKLGLRLSGLLGFGTELALLTVCSVCNKLELYLWLNVAAMNGICIVSILYRRFVLAPRFR